MVLLRLWRVNVKTIPGFINIPLADLSWINMRHNNITNSTNTVDRPQQCNKKEDFYEMDRLVRLDQPESGANEGTYWSQPLYVLNFLF
jgi:hypothetical protein